MSPAVLIASLVLMSASELGPPRLLLYDVEAPAAAPAPVRQVFEELLQRELTRGHRLRVLSQREVATLVSTDAELNKALNCVSADCGLDFAGLADVRYFVTSSLTPLGDELSASVKVYDRNTGNVVVRSLLTLPAAGASAHTTAAHLHGLRDQVVRALELPDEEGTRPGTLALLGGGTLGAAAGGFFLVRARQAHAGADPSLAGSQRANQEGARAQLLARLALSGAALSLLGALGLELFTEEAP